MEKNYSIAMMICYLGKLPWYADYYFHSCAFNRDIDFYIITNDREYRRAIPGNVHFVYMSLDDFTGRVREKLRLEPHINDFYKLCDFKPAYGYLFPEIIAGYDFWGHGDLDVIYGDIRKFMTPQVLAANDLIAVRDDYLTGYFLLFRNTALMNELFMQSKDYRKVLTDARHYCFDETNFNFIDFERNLHYSAVQSEVESMTHVVKKLTEEGRIRSYFDFHVIEGAYGKLNWSKGKLMYKNKFEAMLYHLILFKNKYVPARMPKKIPDHFRISKTKIY